jgi:tetratricopeptide (TPR) repeat protein
MGAVYRALDTQTGNLVAVKLIQSAEKTGDARRFRREFRVLAQLAHPHVITVLDHGQCDGYLYYVMEYVRGPDLRTLLADRGRPLDLTEVLTIGKQMALALAYIHNRGLVHRDVKPANIMLLLGAGPGPGTGPFIAKLADFGLVKVAGPADQLTMSGALVGTLRYLAPEQITGLPVDRRADLYALGLVLYETATVTFPFRGETTLEVAFQRLSRPPVPPQEFNASLPAGLNQLILRLLATEADHRYASAEEILSDLALLQDQPVDIAPHAPARADDLTRPSLIGRAQELDLMLHGLHAAWQNGGGWLLVEGEAGIGKSRLLQELAGRGRQAGGRCLQGACYEAERVPYAPFVEALGPVLAGRSGDPPSEVEGLEGHLAVLFPSLEKTTVGFATLEPEQARLRLFDAVARLLARLAHDSPLVLLLDNLQWADEASLALLQYLRRNLQSVPVLVCGADRSEDLRGEDGLRAIFLQNQALHAESLMLSPLTESATAELVAGFLANRPAPPELPGRLFREAEGNPFFVEEMLKTWVEEEQIVFEGGQWRWSDTTVRPISAPLSTPRGIVQVIERRLQGLSDPLLKTLELASVAGREFNLEVLLCMPAAPDEDTLLDMLQELLRARLLEEVDHPREDRYRFAHSKVREVVHSRISRARARRLHLQAGEALEQVYPSRPASVIPQLAQHFSMAGDQRGVSYGLEAGDNARALYALSEALEHYLAALQLAHTFQEQEGDWIGTLARLHTQAAEILLHLGEYGPAADHLVAVLNLSTLEIMEATVRTRLEADARRLLADVLEAQGQYDQALQELARARQLLSAVPGPSLELALVHLGIAWVKRRQGDLEGAFNSCDQAKEALPAANLLVLADLEDTTGVILRDQGEHERAREHHRRSLSLREQTGDQLGIAKSCNNLAAASWSLGDADTAVAMYRRSLEISIKMEHALGIASVRNNLGLIFAAQGNAGRAVEEYQQAQKLFHRIGNRLGVALTGINLAEVHLSLGNRDRAVEHARAALQESVEIGDQEGVACAHQLLAQAYLPDEPHQAALEGEQALSAASTIGSLSHQVQAHKLLSQAYRAIGQPQRAIVHQEAAKRLGRKPGGMVAADGPAPG